MTHPDITVIVLTYNQHDTIARTLDSILAQRLRHFSMEILIGDDASSDSTLAICSRYADSHPDIIRIRPQMPHLGVVDNYFLTLRLARGRFIADCSGDDFWCDPDKLARQAAILRSRPDVAIVHSAWISTRPDGTSLTLSPAAEPYDLPGDSLIPALLAHTSPMPIHLSTALYRLADLHRALADDPRNIWRPGFACEDLPILCALLSRHRVIYDPRPTLNYSVDTGRSITSSTDRRRAAAYYSRTLRATVILARRYSVPISSLRRYISRTLIHIIRTLL